MNTQFPPVVVLAGGTSSEREVSLRSGQAVTNALQEAGYDAKLHDVRKYDFDATLFPEGTVAFPVLHGKSGEDGHLQLLLDALDVPYVGSGRSASEFCFDKWKYRQLLDKQGVPFARGDLVNAATIWSHPLAQRPFVLKPVDGGSSIDTHIVRNVALVNRDAISLTFTRHHEMLLEELIEGTEITVSVLGDQSLPVIEIIPPAAGEFDYENKYNGATQELCPPKHVSQRAQQAAQELALQVHKLSDCRHYSRTDMIVRNDDSIIVLETNTLPGMTDHSLFPKAAAAAGMTMPELVHQLVMMTGQQS